LNRCVFFILHFASILFTLLPVSILFYLIFYQRSKSYKNFSFLLILISRQLDEVAFYQNEFYCEF